MPKIVTITELQEMLKINAPHLSIVEETYQGMSKKAKFYHHPYGYFLCKPTNIVGGYQFGHPDGSRTKFKQTCMDKYGVETPFQSDMIRSKIAATNVERYGAINPSENKEIRKKAKRTCVERFGTAGVLKNDQIKKKFQKTCLERYGVQHPMQNLQIHQKAAKTNNKSMVILHWQTGKELICTGSYEIKTVEYLNKHKIAFDWQIPFTMPNGRVYVCDLYLLDENKYIEIKGFFRKDAKVKWDWFLENYPNVCLWDKNKLTEMGIL